MAPADYGGDAKHAASDGGTRLQTVDARPHHRTNTRLTSRGVVAEAREASAEMYTLRRTLAAGDGRKMAHAIIAE